MRKTMYAADQFSPLTKQQLKQLYPAIDASELCGPASIVMMLQYTGSTLSFEEALHLMKQSGALVPSVGTILQRVPHSFRLPMRFLRPLPSFALLWLLRRKFVAVTSIAAATGNHIVFVTGCDATHVFYYDPNSTPNRHSMPFRTWKAVFNKRAVVIQQKRMP